MASIRFRSGSWHVQVRRAGYPSINNHFATKADAQKWAREQEALLDKGKFVDVGSLRTQTVEDLLDKFLKEKVPHRKGKRWETVRIDLLKRQSFAKRRLDQNVAGALRDWVKSRSAEVKASTVVRDLSLLGSVFSTAIKEWAVPLTPNPVSLVQRPRVVESHDKPTWTADDLARLRLAAAAEDEAVEVVEEVKRRPARSYVLPALELSIETAMRRGELCSFTRQNVFLDERRIWLPDTKNGTGRNVLLSPRAVEIVKELLDLPAPKGEDRVIPVEADTLGLRFRQLRKAAGLTHLRLHDGRHTATTKAAKVFDNVLELSAFTGHRDLRSLKRYYHPNPTDLAKKLGP